MGNKTESWLIDEYWVSYYKEQAQHYGCFRERISEEYFLLAYFSRKNYFKVIHISELPDLSIYNDMQELANAHKSITPKEWHE
jgi:hypothetical protein